MKPSPHPRVLGVAGAVAAAALLLGACAPPPKPASTARPDHGAELDRDEVSILGELAAIDGRLARRARVTPSEEDLRRVTMPAVLREDRSLAILNGRIDPFSFDARARGLDGVRKRIEGLPADVGGRARERELLLRLVEQEQVRLEEERLLPRSASSLVRAIVDTWEPPRDEREAADTDRWLARRLRELRESMQSLALPATRLDVVRARELDDALDALERIAAAPGYTKSTQELVRLRETLEATASMPAAKAESDWANVARRARAHLGIEGSAEELARELASTEAKIRARAEDAIAAAGTSKDAMATTLERHVLASGACVDAVPGSRIASMDAAPEREPSCHLRHFVANASDARGQALALAVMHDHVVVALWALDVARGAATIAQAEGRHGLLVPILPDTRARYERVALARPVAAIGAGATASILLAGDPIALARSWATLGDVPLDVARRELVPTR